jgi:hypothetical protein
MQERDKKTDNHIIICNQQKKSFLGGNFDLFLLNPEPDLRERDYSKADWKMN